MIFETEGLIQETEVALKYIREIEISSCLNLSLCYLKVKEYHYAIKYSCQVLDKDDENDKAYYRRGVAYLNIGELHKCKEDLLRAHEITQGKDTKVLEAINELKLKQQKHKD